MGAFASTYILCEAPGNKLLLIDQHAAHEKIGFEKLKKSYGSQPQAAQRLLVPLTWEGNARQAATLSPHLEVLQQAGLEIEPFGGNTFVIKSIPSLIKENAVSGLLEQIVQELDEVETSGVLTVAKEHILKTMACHAQVRAHDKLSLEEMQHLLFEMEEYHASHCPHGRPTMVEITLDQIEKWFKRT